MFSFIVDYKMTKTILESLKLPEMVEEEQEPPPTLAQREKLNPEPPEKGTGFTPRPVERLATKKLPRNMLHVELNHRLRSTMEQSTHGHPSVMYQLWLEAGKHAPPYPEVCKI